MRVQELIAALQELERQDPGQASLEVLVNDSPCYRVDLDTIGGSRVAHVRSVAEAMRIGLTSENEGRLVPVQGEGPPAGTWMAREAAAKGEIVKPPGVIEWSEHHEAWRAYAAKYGESQSAIRMAERGGFSYGELVIFLGREPRTWRPR